MMPTNTTKFQVQSMREVQALDPVTRQIAPMLTVQFMVGSHGPFSETFPKSTLDPNLINQRLTDFANKLAQVAGQS